MKKCTKCHTVKETTLQNFNKARYGKYGLSAVCKECLHFHYLKTNGKDRRRIYTDKKWCPSCSLYKLRTDFHKGGRWLKSKCKNCRAKENYNPSSNRHTPPQIRYENHLAYRKKWYKSKFEENPETFRTYGINRRARLRSAEGTFTHTQWLNKLELYGYKCAYCYKDLTLDEATKDHKIPLAKGGTNWIANIVPACFRCNSGKCDTLYSEYRPKYATQAI